MGLILDSSVLIADERGRFDMASFLNRFAEIQIIIPAIVASELLHGVARTAEPDRRIRRQTYVKRTLSRSFVLAFDLLQARVHARIWAELMNRGQLIGAHDLQIAAAGVALDHEVATLNIREFQRVVGLQVVDASEFLR